MAARRVRDDRGAPEQLAGLFRKQPVAPFVGSVNWASLISRRLPTLLISLPVCPSAYLHSLPLSACHADLLLRPVSPWSRHVDAVAGRLPSRPPA